MSDINTNDIVNLPVKRLQDLEINLFHQMLENLAIPFDVESFNQNAIQLDLVRSILNQRLFYLSFDADKELTHRLYDLLEKQNHILEEMNKTLLEIQLYVRSANKKLG